jgi:hypothetical protein
MKSVNSGLTLALCLAALMFAGMACSGSVSTGSNVSNSAPANAANTATAKSEPSPASSKDIAGEYRAKGTNPDNRGSYEANLLVTKRDDVHQFSWDSKGNKYDGVGVTTDNAVAVAYTDGENGKGCGVVLYKINSDGSLDGKVGYWGVNTMETEKAVRKSGSSLEGEYDITGKNPDGKEYKGTLSVAKEGQGYLFEWKAGNAFDGFGIRAGNLIAVGIGGKQCAFLGYDIKPDGTLDGKWGTRTSTTLGTVLTDKSFAGFFVSTNRWPLKSRSGLPTPLGSDISWSTQVSCSAGMVTSSTSAPAVHSRTWCRISGGCTTQSPVSSQNGGP